MLSAADKKLFIRELEHIMNELTAINRRLIIYTVYLDKEYDEIRMGVNQVQTHVQLAISLLDEFKKELRKKEVIQ